MLFQKKIVYFWVHLLECDIAVTSHLWFFSATLRLVRITIDCVLSPEPFVTSLQTSGVPEIIGILSRSQLDGERGDWEVMTGDIDSTNNGHRTSVAFFRATSCYPTVRSKIVVCRILSQFVIALQFVNVKYLSQFVILITRNT